MTSLSVAEVCALQHAAAEWCFRETGSAPTWLLLVARGGGAVRVDLVDGLPPAERVRAVAAEIGAVCAMFSGEFWLGTLSIPADRAAGLALVDLPLAVDLDPAGRREAIVSTAVQCSRPVERRATVIEQSQVGPMLRRIRLEDPGPRSDGLASWLTSILPPATDTSVPGEGGVVL